MSSSHCADYNCHNHDTGIGAIVFFFFFLVMVLFLFVIQRECDDLFIFPEKPKNSSGGFEGRRRRVDGRDDNP